MNILRKFFKLDSLKTNIRLEAIAGSTTFLAMAYIIFVNPDILSATGMDKGALITATILASVVGTLLAGLWANVPFAMAPGMGLNAFFAYSLVIGQKVSWQTALGVVFVSGVLFLILTLCGVRSKVVNIIPIYLRLSIAAGIGLFIALIGFQNLGLVVRNDATMIGLGSIDKSLLLGLIGLLITMFLEVRRIKGSILLGILATTILGLIFVDTVSLPKEMFSLPPSIAPIFFKLDIIGALKWGMWGAIFSFMFVDLFDSVGSIVACSYSSDLVNEDGSIDRLDRILEADAVATVAGALLGTSTTTTYVESGTGIAEGGRSGLANVVTALLFMTALFVTPIIGIVPSFATAPALIVVGIYMFKHIKDVDFRNFEVAVPAFLTIVLIPLTYCISTGLSFGFVAHVLVKISAGKIREIHPVMWGVGIFSFLNLVLLLK
ncbi:MAG: NCS2 family permease [Kiritimatiellae bacterium]|nr:NCS2 family permease [Kiritimatiellia bacterium]